MSRAGDNSDFENWNPMEEDFNNREFNRYSQGVGRDLLSSNQIRGGVELYVNNIPTQLGEEGFYNLFVEFGTVLDKRLMKSKKDPPTETYGFITMANVVEAHTAISKLHNKRICGQSRLIVRPAITNEEKELRKRRAELERNFLEPSSASYVSAESMGLQDYRRAGSGGGLYTGGAGRGTGLGRGQFQGVYSAESYQSAGRAQNIGRSLLGNRPASTAGSILGDRPVGHSSNIPAPRVNIAKKVKPCVFCHKEGSQFRCGNCKMYYCSSDCQRNDWQRHKDVCQAIVEQVTEVNSVMEYTNGVGARPREQAPITRGQGDRGERRTDGRGAGGGMRQRNDSDRVSERGGDRRQDRANGGRRERVQERRQYRPAERTQDVEMAQRRPPGKFNSMLNEKGDGSSVGAEDSIMTQLQKSSPLKTSLPAKLPKESPPARDLARETLTSAMLPKETPVPEKVPVINPIPELSPAENTTGKCYLTYYNSPSKFWLCAEETLENLCVLQELLNNLELKPALSAIDVKVGSVIGIKFEGDWARAHVLKVMGKQATVFFVDFGNEETVDLTNTRALTTEILLTPMQAFSCCLSQVKPRTPTGWSEAAIEAAKEWLGHPMMVHFTYTIKAKRGSLSAVELLKVNESLASFMVEQGFGQRVNNEPLLPNLRTAVGPEQPGLAIAPPRSPGSLGPAQAQQAMGLLTDKSPKELQADMKAINKPVLLSEALKKAKGYMSDSSKSPTPPRPQSQRSPAGTIKAVKNLSADFDSQPQELKQCHLQSDMQNVTVTHVNDCEDFYLSLAENSTALTALMNEVNSRIASLSPLPSPMVGSIGVAKYHADELWYRIRIERLTGQRAVVNFVDFGNTETVPSSALRALPSSLLSLPAQAIKCRLLGKLDNLSADVHEDFKNTQNQLLQARKCSEVGDCAIVQLFLEDGTDLGDLLRIPQSQPTATSEPSQRVNQVSPRQNGPARRLPPTSISQKDLIKVLCVNLLSPQHFYVQMVDRLDTHAGPTVALTTRLKEGGTPAGPVVAGDLVASQFSQDQEDIWYRARVEKMTGPNTCTVFFLDYGNFEEVQVNQLMALSEEDLKLPAGALCCSLVGCSESDDNLTKLFVSTAQEQIDSIKVVSQEEDKLVVEIFDLEGIPITSRFVKQPEVKKTVRVRLETESLPEGSEPIPVTVTSIDSPSQLYVMKCDEVLQEQLLPMLTKLNEEANSLPKLEQACVGAMCAAQFTEDNSWYRAVIENMSGNDQCVVQFVDFGNSEQTQVSQLKELKPEFLDLKGQAIRCCLQGHECGLSKVTSSGTVPPGPLTQADIAKLKSRLLETPVTIRVVARRAGTYVVTMETEHGEPITVGSQPTAGASATPVTVAQPTEPKTQFIPYREDLIDELPTEKTFDAIIHYCVNPLEFFCTKKEEFAQIVTLSENLEGDMQASEVQADHVVVGGVYCCLFADLWYRCVVEEVIGSTVRIFYIDYGNREERPAADLRVLNPERLAVPIYVLRCKLEGLTVNPEVSEENIEMLKSSMQNSMVRVTITGEEADSMLVSATMSAEGVDVDLATELLELGLVVPVQEEEPDEEASKIDQQMEALRRQLEELEKQKRKLK